MYLFSNEPGVLNIATPGTSVFHRPSGTPRRGRGHVAAGGRGFWRPGSSVLRLPSAPAETNTESPFPPELLRLPRYRLVGVFPPNVTSLVRFPCRRLSSPPGDLTHKLRGCVCALCGREGAPARERLARRLWPRRLRTPAPHPAGLVTVATLKVPFYIFISRLAVSLFNSSTTL